MFLQTKRTADFSVVQFVIYSIFQSLNGILFFLPRFAYLHTRNGKTPKSQPSIFVNLRCCVRLCTFAKRGRCRQSRYKHLLVFRVDYLQIVLTLHRHFVDLLPFQLSHPLFESFALFWGSILHKFTQRVHDTVGCFIP